MSTQRRRVVVGLSGGVDSAVSAWLLKRQGLSVLAKISQAVDQRRVPGKELVDGFLIVVAGALMLAPGFIGDVIGYLLLIPPTRALVRIPLVKRFENGTHGRFFTTMGSAAGGRFVGTFRAGTAFDATGQDTDPPDHPRLEP